MRDFFRVSTEDELPTDLKASTPGRPWIASTAGLEAGQTVIVHPSDAITQGVEVEVHAP